MFCLVSETEVKTIGYNVFTQVLITNRVFPIIISILKQTHKIYIITLVHNINFILLNFVVKIFRDGYNQLYLLNDQYKRIDQGIVDSWYLRINIKFLLLLF